MARHLIRGLVAIALLGALADVGAQTLVDPTRPPEILQQSAPVGSNLQPSAQAGLSVVVTAKEGVSALFNGETLRVGSSINGAKVVRIDPDAVFVRDAQGKTERLPLFPEVKITQTGVRANASSGTDKNAPAGQKTAVGGRRIGAPTK